MDSYNYPDSGNSSPRSREVEPSDSHAFFDDAAANYKLKFMVSYGGKIQPRPHDNHLTYVGGETKLLTVDRHLSLPSLLSRLSSLSSDVHIPVSSFKYQLPGEDLDSLISVSSEDDLLHLFLEYDRLLRSSPSSKPPRMRLFLFPSTSTSSSSTQQPPAQSFIDALNSAPAAPQDTLKADPRGGGGGGPNSVDFLLGFEKGAVGAAFRQDPIRSEQAVAADRGLDPGEVQRQLQLELQRMQLRGNGLDSNVYGRKIDEALNASGGVGGYGVQTDYYAPKMVEKSAPQAPPPQQPMPAPAPSIPGYWQEKQMPSVGFPATGVPEQQPMYVIPGHPAGGMYHSPPPQAQMVRQVGSGSGHGYYAVQQRFPTEVYQEHQHPSQQQPQHQMYGIFHQQALSVGQPQAVTAQPQFPKVPSGETMGLVRTSGTGAGVVDAANYAQVMYAAATASGGMVVPSPYQGMVAVSGSDMRLGGGGSGSSTGSLSQEGKVMSKVTQNSL